MKVCDIVNELEKLAPKKLAYEWDNVGLLIGRSDREVKKILLTLDLDINVVKEAEKKGTDLIIGHHPIMFTAVNKITDESYTGRLITELIENKIAYFAAHTNLDIAKGGLNDLLSEKLNIENAEILEYTNEDEGIGRIGDISPITLKEFAVFVKNTLKAPYVRVCGDENKIIRRVAVNTGGGTSLIGAALKENADVFVTGDYKYSQMRDCIAEGMCIIDIGHYDTEIICTELFYSYLKNICKDSIEIFISEENKNVVKFL